MDELKKQEELKLQKIEEEKAIKLAEEKRQLELERQAKLVKAKKQEELRLQKLAEAKKQEEQRLQKIEEEKAIKLAEEKRQAKLAEAKKQEELRLEKIAETKRQLEFERQAKLAEEKRQHELAEAKRQEEIRLQKIAEEKAIKLAEEKRQLELEKQAKLVEAKTNLFTNDKKSVTTYKDVPSDKPIKEIDFAEGMGETVKRVEIPYAKRLNNFKKKFYSASRDKYTLRLITIETNKVKWYTHRFGLDPNYVVIVKKANKSTIYYGIFDTVAAAKKKTDSLHPLISESHPPVKKIGSIL